MNVGTNRDGSIVIDELVTNGTEKWYLTQRYYGHGKRETTITWTGQPDSVTEEGSTWAGQVEITVSHYKQTKQFVAYARYALTRQNERGFNVTHYALYDQEKYPSTRIAIKSAPRYSDKALDLFTDEVITGLRTLAEGNPVLARLLAMAEELSK